MAIYKTKIVYDPREAESMVRAWAKKEYWPILSKDDAFNLPQEICDCRNAIGREKFFQILQEEKKDACN